MSVEARDINLSIAFKKVRDATVCNENLSTAEKIGLLQLVMAEILRDALADAQL